MSCPACGDVGATLVIAGTDRLGGGAERFEVARCEACGLAYTEPRPADAEVYDLPGG